MPHTLTGQPGPEQSKSKFFPKEMSLVLCDNLHGWDREGGREAQEGGDMGIYVYI